MKYSIVTNSHYRRFLKEEDYGFIAEFHVAPSGILMIHPMNKGVDMDAKELRELVITTSKERANAKQKTP